MTKDNYKVDVEDVGSFYISSDDISQVDAVTTSPDRYHVLNDHKAHTVTIMEKDLMKKKMVVKVDDDIFSVHIHGVYDQLIERMGLDKVKTAAEDKVIAPMPGLVLEIMISEGDSIANGQQILILEAMKMENVIKSPGNGVVRSVYVKKGDAVDKGQTMIEIDIQ